MTSSNSATFENLVGEMSHDHSVLQGWDVAIHLLDAAINASLEFQWAEREAQGEKTGGTVTWSAGATHERNGEALDRVIQLQFVLGAPSAELLDGKQEVTVTQDVQITELRTGARPASAAGNARPGPIPAHDPKVSWNAPLELEDQGERRLEATLELSVASKPITSARSINLELGVGRYTLEGAAVGSVDNATVAGLLQHWLGEQKAGLTVLSIDTGGSKEMGPLRPTGLSCSAVTTKAGSAVLQILLATQGRQPPSTGIEVGDPIPTGSGSNFSLMINSRLLFSDFIAAGYNLGQGLIKLVAVDPGPADQSWYARVRNPMQYKGRIRCGDGGSTDLEQHAELNMEFRGSPNRGLVLATEVDPKSTIELQLALSASFPLRLQEGGGDQRLQLHAGTASVTAVGLAENAIKPQLEEFLNHDIKNDMTAISFAPVTSFASKSLQLPGHRLKMSQAEVPGDLVIAGSFEKASA